MKENKKPKHQTIFNSIDEWRAYNGLPLLHEKKQEKSRKVENSTFFLLPTQQNKEK